MPDAQTRTHIHTTTPRDEHHDRKSTKPGSQALLTDITTLNARIDLLKRDVLPLSPFALATPSNLNPRPRDSVLWQCLHGTPFTPIEVWQQYATFRADAPGRDIVTAVLAEDVLIVDEKHGKMSTSVAQSETVVKEKDKDVNRKKISLKDYKDRKGGSTAPGTREGSALPTVEGDDRVVKKRRVSSDGRDEKERAKLSLHPEISPTLPPREDRRSIPPEISPTLPRFEEPVRKVRLPSPISPTLPPVLQRHLDRLLQSNREGLDQEKEKEKRKRTPDLDDGVTQEKEKVRKVNADEEREASPKLSLLVKMKIPKGRRKDVQRILQLRVPSKTIKTVPQKTTPSTKDTSDHAKSAHPETAQKSVPPSLQKRDGLDSVRQSTAEPRTPSSIAQGSLASSPPAAAATDSSRARRPAEDETSRKLQSLQEKYQDSGKRYKRLRDSARNSTSPSSEEVIGLGIQCILSFMKGFTFLDQQNERRSRAGIPAGHWSSLEKFTFMVTNDTRNDSSMNGLVWLLLGVCRARELEAEMARVASEAALAKDKDKESQQAELTTRALNMASQLSSKSRAVQEAFRRGYMKLSTEVLAREFPKTWAASQKSLAYDEDEAKLLGWNVEGGSIEKIPLGLPITSVSHPFEVVLLAESLLEEWRAQSTKSA